MVGHTRTMKIFTRTSVSLLVVLSAVACGGSEDSSAPPAGSAAGAGGGTAGGAGTAGKAGTAGAAAGQAGASAGTAGLAGTGGTAAGAGGSTAGAGGAAAGAGGSTAGAGGSVAGAAGAGGDPLPTCSDGMKNGTESGVDCGGGACPACATGGGCIAPTDCQSAVCDLGSKTCSAPSCTDNLKNGNETGPDCGGPCSNRCDTGVGCKVPTDCLSLVCTAGLCQAPTCTDQVKNADETDVDCGGSTSCGGCADTKACGQSQDCQSNNCSSSTCCAVGQVSCAAGTCSSLQSDPLHCGSCGKACGAGETCAAGACVKALQVGVAVIPNSTTCEIADATVSPSQSTRRLVVDAQNDLYVGLSCAGGIAAVAKSTDGGASFGPPINIATSSPVGKTAPAVGLTLAAGAGGIVHAVWAAAQTVQYARSADGAATWTTPATIGTGVETSTTFRIALYSNRIYIVARQCTSAPCTYLRLFSADDAPAPLFVDAANGLNGYLSFDVMVAPLTGELWLAGDAGSAYFASSQDGGASFPVQYHPTSNNAITASDWAIASANLVGAGATSSMLVPMSDPNTATPIGNHPSPLSNDSIGLDVDQGGRVALGYRVASGTTAAMLRYAMLPPGGQSWLAPVDVVAADSPAHMTFDRSGTALAFAYATGGSISVRVVKP